MRGFIGQLPADVTWDPAYDNEKVEKVVDYAISKVGAESPESLGNFLFSLIRNMESQGQRGPNPLDKAYVYVSNLMAQEHMRDADRAR